MSDVTTANGRLDYYVDLVVKGLIAVIIAVGGYYLREMSIDMANAKEQMSAVKIRTTVLETNGIFTDRQFNQLTTQIDRMNNKLDKLLEGRRGP